MKNETLKLSEQMDEQLCNLPDAEFSMGGTIDRLARARGYASGRAFAKDLVLWGATVCEALELLKRDGGAL